ncbi:Uncharacterized conserved protein, tellurite resistance protein B (TerB) family [Monaibacterium marinum]|uniref:Uncharacterized conserved protein, tellurite resistance protein B (TerB) family n=1 Tax=Pontivivens marinum TaxID=1690039 RepID=A0A2C9CMA9_9RHOB|nr:TerB family tellurite resistance protein [Monaibacterium marinum]SOH92347.1 Uncharacterized conserved protein, tellurite resistance protein B (TerB) family [Monaibacterium marinum]
MFADILRMLTGTPEGNTLDATDARLAMAALLVRVARADDLYQPDEIARIDSVLSRRYSLTPADAAALRVEAEALEEQASDTVRFTRLIKDAVPYEERDAVIEAMWFVVLADDDRSEDENALLRMVANLIGVSDRDSALARQRAQRAQ